MADLSKKELEWGYSLLEDIGKALFCQGVIEFFTKNAEFALIQLDYKINQIKDKVGGRCQNYDFKICLSDNFCSIRWSIKS